MREVTYEAIVSLFPNLPSRWDCSGTRVSQIGSGKGSGSGHSSTVKSLATLNCLKLPCRSEPMQLLPSGLKLSCSLKSSCSISVYGGSRKLFLNSPAEASQVPLLVCLVKCERRFLRRLRPPHNAPPQFRQRFATIDVIESTGNLTLLLNPKLSPYFLKSTGF